MPRNDVHTDVTTHSKSDDEIQEDPEAPLAPMSPKEKEAIEKKERYARRT